MINDATRLVSVWLWVFTLVSAGLAVVLGVMAVRRDARNRTGEAEDPQAPLAAPIEAGYSLRRAEIVRL